MTVIGQSVQRIDSVGKVTGETLFPGDINFPDQLYMKILFAGRPHAIVRNVDTSAAESLKGVLAVLTAKDVPVNEYGLGVNDQPVLCGPGSSVPHKDRVRFVGDQVAVIVAETEAIAEHARTLIRVDYEDLPVVARSHDAIKDSAVLVHPDRNSNVIGRYRIRKGNVERAFASADIIVEGVYNTPVQEHAFLQPEAGVGYIDDEGRVTVCVAGQWAHEDQEQIAHALGLPLDQVRVIYPAIGGAFGGREDMSVQIVLGLAAWTLHNRGVDRPVKIIWSREESIVGHHKRHPYTIRAKWGATKDGKLVAAEMDLLADGGAYVYTSMKVLGNATLMCTGPYEIPNVKVDAAAVYTNNIPNGAFRGFGGPQAAFAAEMQMNKLAAGLNLDPMEMRARNFLAEGSLLSVGTPLPKGVTIGEVTQKCAEAAGWTKDSGVWKSPRAVVGGDLEKPYIKRGIGIACAFKNVGFSFGAPEQSWATVELVGEGEIQEAIVYHAGADCGQGAHTVFMQVAAETLGLPISKIRLVVSDTALTPNSGSASASRMTFMAGNAIRGAAEQALDKWRSEERPATATYQYRPPRTTPMDPETGKAEPNFAYGYVAQAVELHVDTETGELVIDRVICADDVGKAVNPLQVQGQIEGAVVQAAGYAVLENFVQQGGIPKTTTLSTYLIPTILDIPKSVESLILEYADPIGPYGARGMGEMPFLPLTPAIAHALYNATGVWFNEFPLTPERVLDGIEGLEPVE